MASNKNLDLDALSTLLREVGQYRDMLSEKYEILRNAAEACDQAMGSGLIIRKYLNQYNAGLAELSKTRAMVAQVHQELWKEYKSALAIKDSLGV